MENRVACPDSKGVIKGTEEIVARYGRSYASVKIALCEDGMFRMSVSLMASYVGFGGPVCRDGSGFSTRQAALAAGLDQLLRRWPKALEVEPQSVHIELADLRSQIEQQIQQPSFL